MTLHHRKSPRAAFTLLEVLVVIGIIALLATISVSAVFHLRENQKEVNTNRDLTKIDMILKKHYSAAGETIRLKERPSDKLIELTKNADGSPNVERAKALHMKLRLRQEFPQTFKEARAMLTSVPGYNPKPLYMRAIGNGNGSSDEEEGAILLLVFLSQARAGIEFNPEDAATVQTRQLSDGTAARLLVDRWDRPISFRRWALDADPVLGELNAPPFVNAATPPNKMDPQDPDARLQGTWPMKDYWTARFNEALPGVANPFDGTNRGPFVFSFGKDGNPMTADDLFSFRLQGTGKGN